MTFDQILLALGASSALKYALMYLMKDRKPNNLEYVGRISRLNLYPVKSLKDVSLLQANCTKKGLEFNGFFDRRWLIVDSDMRMVTLKMQPRFTFIKVKLLDNGIELFVPSNPDIPTLTLTSDLSKFDKNSKVKIRLYEENCIMYDCGSAGQEWLEKYFDFKGYRFLYFPTEAGNRSIIKHKPKQPWVTIAGDASDLVGCANYAPFLLGMESSLKDLNERIQGNPINMIAFRPNIIIEGTKAWDEDDWEYVFINNACFKKIKDCTRCPMTTVDLEKGKFREDGEPLKTLATFRTKPEAYGKNKTMFGLDVLIKRAGKITVGDAVYVMRTSELEKGYY